MSTKTRRFTITTPLGEEGLHLKGLQGTEAMGRPFRMQAELLSDKGPIDPAKLLGQPATVTILLAKGERTLNGVITSFAEAGTVGRYARFVAVIEPWLALLHLSIDCRIFQHKSIPDVIKDVFREHGFSDFEERLYGTYEPREYVVQYRESAFNFVNRLMEEEGIYYFFKHDGERHLLVMADSGSAHEPAEGYSPVPFYPAGNLAERERDHFVSFNRSQQVQPGRTALTDFDFTKPKANLLASVAAPNDHPHAEFEVYDYPGNHLEMAPGEGYARFKLEGYNAAHERFTGTGNVLGIGAGQTFAIKGHTIPAHDKEYLAVGTDVQLTVNGYETGDALEEQFSATITAINVQKPFRSLVETPKPLIHGLQSAIVVGPKGEEIWVDKYGRVKVQFHWDRLGKRDENSSCWVRVAQVWAGGAWGGVQLPRIGQEVLVEFLEGDPDRPMVTGRVYNGDNMHPYALPENKTQSGVKSRSSKGGGPENFNELRFEDKKGEEQVYFHAEKNMQIVVEHDEAHSVGNDRTKDIVKNETVTVGENRTETVGKNETISIGGNRTETVAKDETVSVDGNRALTVVKNQSLTVSGAQTIAITKDRTVAVDGAEAVRVAKDQSIAVTGDRKVTVGKNDSLNVSKKLLISAGDEIVLKTGSASITMKKNGQITIKGKDISLDASGKISVKASGAVAIKGSKVTGN